MATERLAVTAGPMEFRRDFTPAELVMVAVSLVAVHATSTYNYLLFHSIAEFFSIVIAGTVFIIVINTYKVIKNQYLVVVGISYLFIGILDGLHTLSYVGMRIFTGYDYYAPQFWIASRYLESLAIVAGFLVVGGRHRVNIVAVTSVLLVVTTALIASILYFRIFPVCFIPGKGLTPFKIDSEYVICAILAAGLTILHFRQQAFDPRVYRLLQYSIAMMIVMELCFTLYFSDAMNDLFNEIGHLIKICAFYLLYKAVVVTGLRDPIVLLFHDLKESEESLREAQQLARLGRWEWDPEDDVWFCSPEVLRFFGLPPAGRIPSEVVVARLLPSEGAALRRQLAEVVGGGGGFEMVLHLAPGHGEIRFAQVRGAVQAGHEGAEGPPRVVGTMQDISVNQFSIEKAGEAVCWLNSAGRFAYVNEAACALSGYARDDLLAMPVESVNPDHGPGGFSVFWDELRRRGAIRFETQVRHRDGHTIPAEISAHFLTYAGEEYDVSFVRDMTEHKRKEAEIRRLNDIYAALSHTSRAVVQCRDRTELFERVVNIAVRYGHFRLSWIGIVDEATGDVSLVAAAGEAMGYLDSLHLSVAEDHAEACGPTGLSIRTGQPQVVNDFPNADSVALWREAAARFGLKASASFPLLNGGRCIGAMTLYSDEVGFFTEDRLDLVAEMSRSVSLALDHFDLAAANERQRQELREAVERLTVSNSELERFAYVASHDLQEPLRSIVSFSQLLERQAGDSLSPGARENLDFVITAGRRMSHLITDLMAYSRVNARAVPFTRVSLADACTSAIDNLRDTIAESGAEVAVGDLPEVVGDGVQLMQVFQNLIGNSVKFRRPDLPPRVEVACHRQGAEWVVAVADNGIGVAATDQDIFEIFRRLHPGSNFPGTGVGLAICKRIVQRHGGRIWYETAPGVGSRFFFTLRAEPAG